jgi:hypothetical protein
MILLIYIIWSNKQSTIESEYPLCKLIQYILQVRENYVEGLLRAQK